MEETSGVGWAQGFMPHGHCYLWQPEILWLHVGSDAAITLAYLTIPLALVQLVRRREDLVFDWIFLMFGGFIFFCGLTHAFSIWTTWEPAYLGEGYMKLATAAVSVATAVAVWPLLPRALQLPSTHQLEEANARYQALNEALEDRIRARTIDLERRNVDLERFASFLSHELRQPLNSLSLSTELIAEDAAPSHAEPIGRLRQAVRRMTEMIDAELAMARAVRGSDGHARVDLTVVAREALDELSEMARARAAEVEISPLPSVVGERTQLRQVFRNLLANSLRYARPGVPPRVTLCGEHRDGAIRIELRDNGRGFDPDAGERLFEPYERGESRDREGVGLGLALCRRIVLRHGGTIRAAGSPAEGATFTIELPDRPEDGPLPT